MLLLLLFSLSKDLCFTAVSNDFPSKAAFLPALEEMNHISLSQAIISRTDLVPL